MNLDLAGLTMNIISRAQAKASNLNRYFTGVPCRNGHVDFRYTASGACKSCIAENNLSQSTTALTDDPDVVAAKKALEAATAAHAEAIRVAELRRQAENATRNQAKESQRIEMETLAADIRVRQEAKAQLVRLPVRCYDVDLDGLAAAAWALAVMRYPALTQGDVDPRLLPKDKAGGTALYSFLCHHEDVPQLRQIADGMLKAHKADVVAVRRAAFGPAADGRPMPDQTGEPWPGDPDYK